MCCGKNITPTPIVRKFLMAKAWYFANFSGFYVIGKYYNKVTGIAIQCEDVPLRWENKTNLSKN